MLRMRRFERSVKFVHFYTLISEQLPPMQHPEASPQFLNDFDWDHFVSSLFFFLFLCCFCLFVVVFLNIMCTVKGEAVTTVTL